MTIVAGEDGPLVPGPLPAGLTRDELVHEVRRALRRVPPEATVAVAASGGPDSAALAFLTADARPDLVLVLAHVRHGLRDDRFDVAAVTAQASYLGVPLETVEVTVEPAGQGVEAAARAQRYAALRRVARAADAGWLLLGHTADDQAETLLLRIARGTGVPGLGGMPAVRGDVVRPLLRIRRGDIRRFVHLEGLPVAEDPTNRDRAHARNQVRLDVLPLLERFAPDPVGALSRLADLARDDAMSLRDRADEILASAWRRVGPVVCVPTALLDEHDPAITRRLVRSMVIEARAGGDPPTAAEVEALRCLRSGGLDLAGVSATAASGWLTIGPSDIDPVRPVPLTVPGATSWATLGWTLVATTEQDDPERRQLQLGLMGAWVPPQVRVSEALMPPGARAEHATVVLGGLGDDREGLVVRTRRPGDRIHLRVGTRKLQDVMVDAGLPRPVRSLLPLVCLGDRILWVPGLAVDVEAQDAGQVRADLQIHVRRR